ncbi:MAG: DNA gyrase subunit A [Chloroflexi bacterium]|nr:DNA gyrase subunit A [Chloroflexota bacterium]
MRDSYLDYAMSVIVSRALPDVRDGLKPVQRRILFGMQELGVGPNSALKKTARVVGEVMGKFHPHGDQAIYDTLVRMAQDFTMRYPLVTGQGNFGSVDGDPPAQMRYTEARLAPIASELLADLDRNTVDFQPNFDDSVNEPVVLPSRIPNLLLNGASGIAVGMATNVPPHNLNEICDALTLLIDRPEAGIDELMEHVQGPDFPTRGRIFGREAIRQAYASGRGKVTMQGVISAEQTEAGRIQLVVTELPYQVNKSTLIQRIADLVRNKRIEGVSDLRDESDRDGMRIVIELSRTGTPAAVEAQLFKLTALQSTFAVNMLALVDGRPKTVSLKEALEAFIDHRREVIRRRSEFDLQKAEERAEILDGLLKAIEQLDWVIATIRASESADAAKTALMAGPEADAGEPWLSERQAQAVLDMQLRRLAALERQRIEDEHAELAEQIAWLRDLLANPEKIDGLIKDDCAELKEQYGDARLTRAFAQPADEISADDLVPHQRIVVTISDAGYMKRVPLETYRRQRRGGRGITGAPTRDEDAANHLVVCDTHDSLLLFTQQGRVYSLRGYEAPEATRQARGIPVVNLVEMEATDRVTGVVVVADFSRDSMVLATAGGDVKRTPLEQFESVRRAGLIAMKLKRGDSLIAAHGAADGHDALLVSSGGRAIRFPVGSLRVASRASGGVRGMRLRNGERVVGLVIDTDGEDLLVVSEQGFGKRTPIEEYPTKGRGGQGMLTFRVMERTGPLAVARAVTTGQEIILVSRDGIVMRTHAETISQQGRGTQGVAVMNIGEGDALAALALIDLDEDNPRRRQAPEPEPEPEDADEAPPASAVDEPTGEAGKRKAADVGSLTDAELREALEAVLPAGEWTPHLQVLKAAARRLRFTRLSQALQKALGRAIHGAVVDGWIEENGETQELRRPGA